MRWLARQWPLFLWAGIIWTFSTHWFGSDHTSRLILPALRWFFPHASLTTLEKMHGLIRESGHVAEYFIFSLLVLRAIRNGRPGWKLVWATLAVIVVLAYASLDEFHQSFVPNRTASPRDVALDTTAGAVAQVLAGLVIVEREERRRLSGSS